MKKLVLALSVLSCFSISAAQAQGGVNSCPGGSVINVASQDACQMAVDVFQFLAPQLGLGLTGGNATLGRGSALGGPGHFSIGVRANVFQGDVPDIEQFPTPSPTGAQPRTLPSSSQILGVPTADAAIGLFAGVPLGLTNVGGIDLLLSATYVPTFGDAGSEIQVKPEHNWQVGYGVRVGLLQESLVLPGVSFTFLKRDLPTTTITGTSSSLDVNIMDASVHTTAYRVVASKSLILFGVAAGVGQDKYDQKANVQGTGRASGVSVTSSVVPLSQDLTRTNYFLDLSMNFPLVKLIGEIGQVTGGDVSTFNTFTTGPADKSRTYGSLGVRVGF
jgi:hypothetical protein